MAILLGVSSVVEHEHEIIIIPSVIAQLKLSLSIGISLVYEWLVLFVNSSLLQYCNYDYAMKRVAPIILFVRGYIVGVSSIMTTTDDIIC